MLSGGSSASASVTLSASTTTTQVEPRGRSTEGSSVNVAEGPEAGVTLNAWAPPGEQAIVNAPAAAFTASLKFTVMFPLAETPVAPFVGVVEVTVGASSGSST